jgi:dTMP kinase
MVRFITFEGGDGSGKTTQIGSLRGYLEQTGRPCLVTREPGGTVLGELIRKVLLDSSGHKLAPSTELFLYLADRSQHVNEIIFPALDAGKIVLCDRFTDSTLAYQGYGRGIDLNWLRQLNKAASGMITPDLTFLLDCPVDLGLSRTHRRESKAGVAREDRFEREKVEFHEKVRAGFLEIARREPLRFRVIDAAMPIEEIAAAIRRIIDQELANELR